MKNIFIINGAHAFEHSGGKFNQTLSRWSEDFFSNEKEYSLKTTSMDDTYDLDEEVAKFLWADIIVYHFPVWWFQVPFGFKKYLDEVFTHGHGKIYINDGRSRTAPKLNYGRGGGLQGKEYMLTSSWNAPSEAFTLEGEFFGQKSVDEGVLYGFHKMNEFTGLKALPSIHFHDVEKDVNIEKSKIDYKKHLENIFIALPV